jgi:hypothetical protein
MSILEAARYNAWVFDRLLVGFAGSSPTDSWVSDCYCETWTVRSPLLIGGCCAMECVGVYIYVYVCVCVWIYKKSVFHVNAIVLDGYIIQLIRNKCIIKTDTKRIR